MGSRLIYTQLGAWEENLGLLRTMLKAKRSSVALSITKPMRELLGGSVSCTPSKCSR